MAISESALEELARQGDTTKFKFAADQVRKALEDYPRWPQETHFEVFLQGSYRNDTNTYQESDVDIVAQLDSVFYNNLSQDQKRQLELFDASYNWAQFRADVINSLVNYFGLTAIEQGNKAVKIIGVGSRMSADVIVAVIYRNYWSVSDRGFAEGICFWTQINERQIINYPKLHYQNAANKNSQTQNFKKAVRVFKKMRNYIDNKNHYFSPSYFIESLIYNVPNSCFSTTLSSTIQNTLQWLSKSNFDSFVTPGEQSDLFGSAPEQWNQSAAKEFIQRVITVWNNW
jgi:hypothetical protein